MFALGTRTVRATSAGRAAIPRCHIDKLQVKDERGAWLVCQDGGLLMIHEDFLWYPTEVRTTADQALVRMFSISGMGAPDMKATGVASLIHDKPHLGRLPC